MCVAVGVAPWAAPLGGLRGLGRRGLRGQAQDEARRKSAVDAVRSPTMAGGLFAANRAFFYSIGGYDTEVLYCSHLPRVGHGV